MYKNDLLELNNAHENEMLKSQIHTQENTFQNISREIHDNIGQKLTLAKLHLNGWIQLNSLHADVLVPVVTMISESLQDLRDISRSLSSEVILQNGLIKALENEISIISKTVTSQFHLRVIGDPSFMHSSSELVLFRIIQEALANIIKHASANRIEIEFEYLADRLHVLVADDGVGFDQSKLTNLNGLNNMRNRAQLLQGSFEVSSSPSQGTRLHIIIPLNSSPQNISHA